MEEINTGVCLIKRNKNYENMKKTILQYVAKRQTKNEGVHERIYERT